MIVTFARQACKEIDEQVELVSNALEKGGAKDFAKYKELVGSIAGLRLAHRIITDLADASDRQG